MSWRVLLALLLVTGLVHAEGNDPLPTAKPEDVGLSSARLDRLAQALRGDIDRGRMPGAVLAITRKGKLADTCGRFIVSGSSTAVELSVPYALRTYDGWVVTRRGSDKPLLST